jgi:chemotaxis protein methyltransferase CheR
LNRAARSVETFRELVAARFHLAFAARFDRQLQRGLDRAGAILGLKDDDAICGALAMADWTEPAWQAAIEAITVRETSFFRQRNWWDSIADEALRPLIAARRRDGSRRLRCLSVGCASGEEPYSLAIILDRLLAGEPGWTVEIVGLDLCEAALRNAREGVYDRRSIREVADDERARWFRPAGRQGFVLDEAMRARVGFHLFNLREAAAGAPSAVPGAPADLVMCRNVLIHIAPERQAQVAAFIGELVAPGGTLALSPVESNAAWFASLTFRVAPHAILFAKPRRGQARRGGAQAAPSPALVAAPQPPRLADVEPAIRLHSRERAPDATTMARLGRARRLADLGLFEEARRLCEHVLPETAEGDLLMALVCQALGDLAAADVAARRGLERAPGLPAAHYVHAIVCLRAGKTDEARRALRDALQLLNDLDDAEPVGKHLGIEAGQVRQAARRLGIRDLRAGGRHG